MTFKDKNGGEWNLSLTVGLLGRIRERTQVDIGKAMRSNDGLAEVLFAEPETLVRILWIVCEQQAEKREASPEQFADLFDGPTIEGATEALLGAVADFFPRSKISKLIKARLPEMLAKMDEQSEKEVNRMLDQALAKISTPSEPPGSLPALPASTPQT